jgi:methyltransferase
MTLPQRLLLYTLLLLALQRLLELGWARRNERWLRAQGALEFGASHYRYIVGLHAGFFISLALEGFYRGPQLHARWPIIVGLLLMAQILRYWCLSSLGRFWNTKIFVIPGAGLIQAGPYRWLKHPNYGVVIAEIFLVPLLFHAWWTLLAASLINLIVLRIRITEEEKALTIARNNNGG